MTFRPSKVIGAVFALTLCWSAFLLFLIQPMLAKSVLPLLGGGPGVWNTCVFFFQFSLLLGYLYAHVLDWSNNRRVQYLIHSCVILLATLAVSRLSLGVFAPPDESHPIRWLVAHLSKTVGIPFIVLSTSAPLLQRWFSETRHKLAADPYFLYTASNLGSLVALVSYPFLIEPFLSLGDQEVVTRRGWGVWVLLTLLSMFLAWGFRNISRFDKAPPVGSPGISWQRRTSWFLLAFAPSSLTLGLTTFLTTDVAAFPLAWIIPLLVYLATYILSFARRRVIRGEWLARAFPYAMILTVLLMSIDAAQPIVLIMALHLACFAVIALLCHMRLADDRPDPDRLTEFYLCLCIGGAAGGVLNGILAPVVFRSTLEYPIVLFLSCFLVRRTRFFSQPRLDRCLDIFLPACTAALSAGLLAIYIQAFGASVRSPASEAFLILCLAVPFTMIFSFQSRPIRFGLALAGTFFATGLLISNRTPQILCERSFYGVSRVMLRTSYTGELYHMLAHGTTIHGLQSLDPQRRGEPLAYYHRTGPAGQVFRQLNQMGGNLKVAVVGLGAGSLAAYSRPTEQWDFYEIDPVVAEIASDPRYFSFLKDMKASHRIVMGDGRLMLGKAPDRSYDLIVLDAFSSDSIPVHLFTLEAIRIYLSKVADRGFLAFNISNRYLKLEQILGEVAASAGLACMASFDQHLSIAEIDRGKTGSKWLVMTRREADVGLLLSLPSWFRLQPSGQESRIWTDDYSNILGAF